MSQSDVLNADQNDDEDRPEDPTLAGELEVLREENRRLREEYVRARQSQYRRTATALVAVGLLTAVAGVLFPSSQTVLFALGGTGVFIGVLTFYLTPERFLTAAIGENVYDTLAVNEAAIVAELGLTDDAIYVPPEDETETVRLFVPQHTEYERPSADALSDIFVVTDDERERGAAFRPTGAALYDSFEGAVTGDPGADPATRATQLADALVEQFELVDSAQPDVDAADGRVTVRVTGSALGDVNRFDHPVASLLAVGIARCVSEPVTLEVAADEDATLVTCAWETEGE